jgi:hypothetical protein
MDKLSRLVGIAACVSALAAAGCASNSGVTPSSGSPMSLQQQAAANGGWIHDGGVTYAAPHYMATLNANRPAVKPNTAPLVYGNGPVLTKPKMYLIFWGYKANGDTDKVKKLLVAYGKTIGGSGHNNIYTQYYQIVSGVKTMIQNENGQWGGSWADNTTPVPTHPTDAQVAAEALVGVAHFGYNANASYVVATPHGHSSSGFATSWCAYHSATTYNHQIVSYTNLPYMPDAGQNCGSNIITAPSDEMAVDEGVTIVEGHEYGESVTDPNPPSGWYNNGYGEIGDICAWQNILNDPFRTSSWTSQPMFSNATDTCVHSY